MSLIRWSPIRDFNSIADEFDNMFENFLSIKRREPELVHFDWRPVTNFKEDEENYIMEAEIPGMKKDDIKITLKDGILTVSGERKEEKEKKEKHSHLVERSYGSFCRSFALPTDVKEDKIDASYKDGILKVTVPKAEEVKAKEIAIK